MADEKGPGCSGHSCLWPLSRLRPVSWERTRTTRTPWETEGNHLFGPQESHQNMGSNWKKRDKTWCGSFGRKIDIVFYKYCRFSFSLLLDKKNEIPDLHPLAMNWLKGEHDFIVGQEKKLRFNIENRATYQIIIWFQLNSYDNMVFLRVKFEPLPLHDFCCQSLQIFQRTSLGYLT